MELNEKRAKWVGFRHLNPDEVFGLNPDEWWHYPEGGFQHELPPFTESLDACFKWLVPKYLMEFGEDATLELLTEWAQSLILVYSIDQGAAILCKLIDTVIVQEVLSD